MKTCSICKRDLSLTLFNKNKSKKDGLQTHCRDCGIEKSKAYYAENSAVMRPMILESRKLRQEESRVFVVEYLKTHPCVDCGTDDIRILEFDHVRGVKKDGVGKLISNGNSIEVIKEEIAKCEVRCKNHHAIKTYERMGGSWHDKFLTLH